MMLRDTVIVQVAVVIDVVIRVVIIYVVIIIVLFVIVGDGGAVVIYKRDRDGFKMLFY